MKTSLRRLTHAVLLLVIGFAAFHAAPLALRALSRQRGPAAPQPPLPQVVMDAPAGTGGNQALLDALRALESREALQMDIVETGVIAGRRVESIGHYRQLGRGDARRFSLLLQGRIHPSGVRLWQVSDGRFLWTDLAWGEPESVSRRQVWRVDLRRVRADLQEGQAPPVAPGGAQAQAPQVESWGALGGLPMLLESLRGGFDFQTPRRMSLRNEPVYAMLGRWKPWRRAALSEGEPTEAEGGGLAFGMRSPHHVLVALSARTLLPCLIEYRGEHDPLASPGLAEDARYHESQAPLLRLDFTNPRFDPRVADADFAYAPPDGVAWEDLTGQRLRLLKARRELAVASAPSPPHPASGVR